MYHIFKSLLKENCKNLFDNIFKRVFDDEHDTKNYLINKRSVKLVLIRIVKIAILKIFINN